MSSEAVTLPQAIARLRAFDEDHFVKAATNAIRRAMSAGRSHAYELVTKSKVGQQVARLGTVRRGLAKAQGGFTRSQLSAIKGNVIPLIVKRGKLELREDLASGRRSWRGSLVTEGFAALIETGGKTKPHAIKPIRLGGYSRKRSKRAQQLAQAGYLTFLVGGRWVSKKTVTHPGSKIPRNPFMEKGGARAESVMTQQLETGISDAIKKAGL